jgi:hypothetical protein
VASARRPVGMDPDLASTIPEAVVVTRQALIVVDADALAAGVHHGDVLSPRSCSAGVRETHRGAPT